MSIEEDDRILEVVKKRMTRRDEYRVCIPPFLDEEGKVTEYWNMRGRQKVARSTGKRV